MHFYVHVPFCARRCSYCDFAIAVRRATPDQEFVAAVTAEWQSLNRDGILTNHPHASTLYFGGGTPSRLGPPSLRDLIDMIVQDYPLTADAEVTLETNPDDVTADRARAWAAGGINRISLGVQSHEPRVLEWMHRAHRADQVPRAVETLRDAGFDNISIDLIFALPAALARDWTRDIELTLDLLPTHVSLYGLTIESHTPLYRWMERGTAVAATDDRYADEYRTAHRLITARGFQHYEVSNAGLPGFHSRHNQAYWSGAEYIGLGPSAHSFVRGQRRWNVREWADYHARAAAARSVVAGSEVLDADARSLEQRYLGLRTTSGLPLELLPSGQAATWCEQGWATVDTGRLVLTLEGWLRLDALVGAAGRS